VITIFKSGAWGQVVKILSDAHRNFPQAVEHALFQEAHELRKNIIQGITQQAPGGLPFRPALSPLTLVARKLKRFGGSKTLMVRADLRNSVAVVAKGCEAFVGVLRKARSRTGGKMVDIAEVQEFGSRPIVIRVTPRMRRFLWAMLRKTGIDQPSRATGKSRYIVTRVPARPFLRPARDAFVKGLRQRFEQRIANFGGGKSK